MSLDIIIVNDFLLNYSFLDNILNYVYGWSDICLNIYYTIIGISIKISCELWFWLQMLSL